MQSAFRKISRVGRMTGATRWYLSGDCLLAAKQVLYAIEYRRFYLRDLESIVVWPNRLWLLRPIIPALLFGVIGAALWRWVNFTAGAISCALGLAWVVLELALGPTAESRICTTGATVDLPLVARVRRARKVLAKVDAAVRVARGAVAEQPTAPIGGRQQAQPSATANSEASPATTPIEDLT